MDYYLLLKANFKNVSKWNKNITFPENSRKITLYTLRDMACTMFKVGMFKKKTVEKQKGIPLKTEFLL